MSHRLGWTYMGVRYCSHIRPDLHLKSRSKKASLEIHSRNERLPGTIAKLRQPAARPWMIFILVVRVL